MEIHMELERRLAEFKQTEAVVVFQSGFTANAGAFEHKQGFLELFNGAGTYDTAKMLEAWGAPYEIVVPGIAVKQYPCCGSTHPAIDVMGQTSCGFC